MDIEPYKFIFVLVKFLVKRRIIVRNGMEEHVVANLAKKTTSQKKRFTIGCVTFPTAALTSIHIHR